MSDAEQYLFSIVEGIQAKENDLGFAALSEREKTFAAVWGLEAEVNNGGFNQYFSNSAGDHCREAVTALQAIGAHHTSKLVEEAIAVFGSSGPSRDWETRQEQVDELDEQALAVLESLDEQFYRYEDDLSGLLARYMQDASA